MRLLSQSTALPESTGWGGYQVAGEGFGVVFFLVFFFFFCPFGIIPAAQEVPRLGVQSELQLPQLHHSHSNVGS